MFKSSLNIVMIATPWYGATVFTLVFNKSFRDRKITYKMYVEVDKTVP